MSLHPANNKGAVHSSNLAVATSAQFRQERKSHRLDRLEILPSGAAYARLTLIDCTSCKFLRKLRNRFAFMLCK
jgi:hypothetical protein